MKTTPARSTEWVFVILCPGKDLVTRLLLSSSSIRSCDPYSSPYVNDASHLLLMNTLELKNSLDYKRVFISMCPGKDLNLHASRRLLLRQVRLPISPPGLIYLLRTQEIIHENML